MWGHFPWGPAHHPPLAPPNQDSLRVLCSLVPLPGAEQHQQPGELSEQGRRWSREGAEPPTPHLVGALVPGAGVEARL